MAQIYKKILLLQAFFPKNYKIHAILPILSDQKPLERSRRVNAVDTSSFIVPG